MQRPAHDEVPEPMEQLTQALSSARLALEHLVAAGIDAADPAVQTCAAAVSLIEQALTALVG
jgi:hypothetical protein